MLYQIDGTQTRIFGTMHAVPGGQQAWVPYARRVFDWSERQVFEMRPSRSRELLALPSPHCNVLPAKLQARAEELWNSDALGTIAQTNLPAMWLVLGTLGLGAEEGVEPVMSKWAAAPDQIGELETPKEFLRVFDDVPAEALFGAIEKRFRVDQEAKRIQGQLYRAWRGNSGDKMNRVIRAGIDEPMRSALFQRRNAAWTPQIAELSKAPQRTLLCIGAGHLHGEGNVRELLASQHGLACTRVDY